MTKMHTRPEGEAKRGRDCRSHHTKIEVGVSAREVPGEEAEKFKIRMKRA